MPVDPFDIPHLFADPSRRVEFKEYGTEWEEPVGPGDASAPRAVRLLFDVRALRWLTLIVLVVFSVLAFRLFFLQVARGVYFRAAADENRFRVLVAPASRGVIYDADRDSLVQNEPIYDVAVVPVDLPDLDSEDGRTLLDRFSSLVSVSSDELRIRIEELDPQSYEPATVVEDISREASLQIQAHALDLPGVQAKNRSRRMYEGGSDFAHILGYVGKISEEEYDAHEKEGEFYLLDDVVGKTGLESSYESELRGTYGRRQVEVDSLGSLKSVVAEEADVPGQNLILSIDKDFQAFIRERLNETVRVAGSKAGSVVAIDPRTGDILALVSQPSFDPNLFSDGISQEDYTGLIEDEGRPLFHRSVMGTFPPGSIVKPVVASVALDEGVMEPGTIIHDKGSIQVPHDYNPDIVYTFVGWERAGLGAMDVFSAIAKSSDIYFYTIAGGHEGIDGLGKERLAKGYRDFGMGSPLGVDLPSEASGLVPTEDWKIDRKGEYWYRGDTYHMGIGQGDLLVTPLQAASWTAALANGGTLYQPRLVRKTYDVTTEITRDVQPIVLSEQVVSPSSTEIVRQAMRQTVLDGSGRALQSLHFTSAGKTGTAQYAGNTKEHAWYVGFAPYEDPEIAIAVLVEGGGDGDKVAVPLAGEVMNWYMTQ